MDIDDLSPEQRKIWNALVDAVECGDVLAVSEVTTGREWFNDPRGGSWLHPGELLIDVGEKRYIITVREALVRPRGDSEPK